MILRKPISILLATLMLMTSASAHSSFLSTPAGIVFLANENGSPRCQLTPRAAELFSLEQLQHLAQRGVLEAIGGEFLEELDGPLRPCGEGDVLYARVAFARDVEAGAMGMDKSLIKVVALVGIGAALFVAGSVLIVFYLLDSHQDMRVWPKNEGNDGEPKFLKDSDLDDSSALREGERVH